MSGDRASIVVKQDPGLQHPSLLITWSADAGRLGPTMVDQLRRQLQFTEFAEIEPLGFFPTGGVVIDDDVVQFPASKFYARPGSELIVFHSMQPQSKLHSFLSTVVDVAQQFKVKDAYIAAGLGSRMAHVDKRRVRTIVNMPEVKEQLSSLGLDTWMSYQGPPSINSFFLWVARNRSLPAATFWGEIPFYLSGLVDWRGVQVMLGAIMRKFALELSFEQIDREVDTQQARLEELMKQNLEVGNAIGRLERGEQLTREEAESLARNVVEWF